MRNLTEVEIKDLIHDEVAVQLKGRRFKNEVSLIFLKYSFIGVALIALGVLSGVGIALLVN